MSEPNKDELLDTSDKEKIEIQKEEKLPGQFTPLSLTLMVLIVLGLLATGCWYTYYQYKRMEEINSAQK